MLIEPGPIVPLDWAELERRLSPEDPLDVLDDIGPEFTAAADQLDIKAAELRAATPPDEDPETPDPALVEAQAELDEFAGDALQPFDAALFGEVDAAGTAQGRFASDVYDQSLIAPSAAPEGQGFLDAMADTGDGGVSGGGGPVDEHGDQGGDDSGDVTPQE